MSTFIARDGAGDLTIWQDDPERTDFPTALVRECEVSPGAWRVLVAGVESLGAAS